MIIKMLLQYMFYLLLGLLAIIFLGILTGCGQNPTGAPPPVLHFDTFEEHIAAMKTPGHTAKWMDQFSKYSDPYTGWVPPEGKDLAWSLAHDFWKNYIQGYSRGKCGSFAAMQAVCARNHGYNAGVIVWYHWDDDGGVWGHAEAWMEEDGRISTQSNDEYIKGEYGSYEEMKAEYIRRHVSLYGYITFYDSYWRNGEEVIYEGGTKWGR